MSSREKARTSRSSDRCTLDAEPKGVGGGVAGVRTPVSYQGTAPPDQDVRRSLLKAYASSTGLWAVEVTLRGYKDVVDPLNASCCGVR
jgi:hypothetical protein